MANTDHAIFNFPIRVYIEDTDAGGIVYHANHIRFLERARTEWLRALSAPNFWQNPDFSLVVYKLDIDYVKPILMNDLLTVQVELTACRAASFSVKQQILRGDTVLSRANVTIACLNNTLKAQRLPTPLFQLLSAQMPAHQ